MEKNFIDSLKSIQSLLNYYVVTLLTYLLASVAASISPSREGFVRIFGLEIHREQISFAVGALFLIFILILFLRMRKSLQILELIEVSGARHFSEAVTQVKYLPWVTSPFSPDKYGAWIFGGLITAGYVLVFQCALGHLLCLAGGTSKVIGAFDALCLLVAIFVGRRISATTAALRGKLNSATAPSRLYYVFVSLALFVLLGVAVFSKGGRDCIDIWRG